MANLQELEILNYCQKLCWMCSLTVQRSHCVRLSGAHNGCTSAIFKKPFMVHQHWEDWMSGQKMIISSCVHQHAPKPRLNGRLFYWMCLHFSAEAHSCCHRRWMICPGVTSKFQLFFFFSKLSFVKQVYDQFFLCLGLTGRFFFKEYLHRVLVLESKNNLFSFSLNLSPVFRKCSSSLLHSVSSGKGIEKSGAEGNSRDLNPTIDDSYHLTVAAL